MNWVERLKYRWAHLRFYAALRTALRLCPPGEKRTYLSYALAKFLDKEASAHIEDREEVLAAYGIRLMREAAEQFRSAAGIKADQYIVDDPYNPEREDDK